jgi:histidyl-tRNA synthetase
VPKQKKDKQNAGLFQLPKGMRDILPYEQPLWDRILKVARDISEFYNFNRIDTPVLEFAKLFEKTNEETDLVQKEMYTLKTKGGDNLALRPEFTAPIMRSYVEHGLSRLGQPQKLYTTGQVFRHENTQQGRQRQFTQYNLEVIGGANDPIYDAQVVLIFQRFLEELKIKNIILKMNSIGCKVCRPIYKKQLQNYYKNFEKKLCVDCQKRYKTNPLRLLDCKQEQCQEFKKKAPTFFDKLCVTCSTHLKGVLEYLDELGISYELDNTLVRGLDYYSKTVFEFYVDGVDVGAVVAGGRYDYLMEMLGGRLTPAVGGASGIERIIAVMKAQEVKMPERKQKRVFLIHVGELAKKKSMKVIEDLRIAGIPVMESLGRESLKAQLKAADKEGIELALIFGQRELFEGSIILRDLRNSLQETVSLNKLVEEIKKRMKG